MSDGFLSVSKAQGRKGVICEGWNTSVPQRHWSEIVRRQVVTLPAEE